MEETGMILAAAFLGGFVVFLLVMLYREAGRAKRLERRMQALHGMKEVRQCSSD